MYDVSVANSILEMISAKPCFAELVSQLRPEGTTEVAWTEGKIDRFFIDVDRILYAELVNYIKQETPLTDQAYENIYRFCNQQYKIAREMHGSNATSAELLFPNDVSVLRAIILDTHHSHSTEATPFNLSDSLECMSRVHHTDPHLKSLAVIECMLRTLSNTLQRNLIAYIQDELNLSPWYDVRYRNRSILYHALNHGQVNLFISARGHAYLTMLLGRPVGIYMTMIQELVNAHPSRLPALLMHFSVGIQLAVLLREDESGNTPVHTALKKNPAVIIPLLQNLPSESRLLCLVKQNLEGKTPYDLLKSHAPDLVDEILSDLPPEAQSFLTGDVSDSQDSLETLGGESANDEDTPEPLNRNGSIVDSSLTEDNPLMLPTALRDKRNLSSMAIEDPTRFLDFYHQQPPHHRLCIFLGMSPTLDDRLETASDDDASEAATTNEADTVSGDSAVVDIAVPTSLRRDLFKLSPETLLSCYEALPDADKFPALTHSDPYAEYTWLHHCAAYYPTLIQQFLDMLPPEANKVIALGSRDHVNVTPLHFLANASPEDVPRLLVSNAFDASEIQHLLHRKDNDDNTVMHVLADTDSAAFITCLSLLPIESRVELLRTQNKAGFSPIGFLLLSHPERLLDVIRLLKGAQRIDILKFEESFVLRIPLHNIIKLLPKLFSVLTEAESIRLLDLVVPRTEGYCDDEINDILGSMTLRVVQLDEQEDELYLLPEDLSKLQIKHRRNSTVTGLPPEPLCHVLLATDPLAVRDVLRQMEKSTARLACLMQEDTQQEALIVKIAKKYPNFLSEILACLTRDEANIVLFHRDIEGRTPLALAIMQNPSLLVKLLHFIPLNRENDVFELLIQSNEQAVRPIDLLIQTGDAIAFDALVRFLPNPTLFQLLQTSANDGILPFARLFETMPLGLYFLCLKLNFQERLDLYASIPKSDWSHWFEQLPGTLIGTVSIYVILTDLYIQNLNAVLNPKDGTKMHNAVLIQEKIQLLIEANGTLLNEPCNTRESEALRDIREILNRVDSKGQSILLKVRDGFLIEFLEFFNPSMAIGLGQYSVLQAAEQAPAAAAAGQGAQQSTIPGKTMS